MYVSSDLHYQPKKETVVIPTRIGQKFEGGYFAGVIRVKDCAYAILVAPKSTEGSIQFKTHCSSTSGIQLVNDGWANTNAMNDVEHPAAQYCRSLTVGGHTDLYLPSCDELELCYRVFKPTARDNLTSPTCSYAGNLSLANGTSRSSIPTGAAYTKTDPARTIVTAFRAGSVEAFDADRYYWTSTESSSNTNRASIHGFSDGNQFWTAKTYVLRVRGIRRVLIVCAASSIKTKQIKSQKVHLTRAYRVRELCVLLRSILARLLQPFLGSAYNANAHIKQCMRSVICIINTKRR